MLQFDINKLHVHIIMLHDDVNKSHVDIIMLHVDIIYLTCRGQKYATILNIHITHCNRWCWGVVLFAIFFESIKRYFQNHLPFSLNP